MSYVGGITWKHPDYQNVVIHSIPMNMGQDMDLPKDLEFLSSSEYSDVSEVFMPYISQDVKYGKPNPKRTRQVAHRYKVKGNEKYKSNEFREAYKLYQCSWKLFEMLQQHDPDAKKEIVMLLSNLSATCSKLRHGKDALEFANKCLKLDPEFVKGHFRRAEAHKIFASDMVTETDEQQKKCMEHLYQAMHAFMKCYEMMVDPKDQPSRLKQFCESVKMSIVLNATRFLPEIHSEDRPHVVFHLLEFLMTEYQPKLVGDMLDYLLFHRLDKKFSGLAKFYPGDCSSLSIQPLIKKGVLNTDRLTELRKLKITVRDSDILLAMEDAETDNILFWYELVNIRCTKLDRNKDDHLTEIFDTAVSVEKIPFVRFLLTNHRARPSKQACLKSLKLFRNDPGIRPVLFMCLSEKVRGDMILHFFMKSDQPLLNEVLESGPFDFTTLDLSDILTSSLLAQSPRTLSIFLKHEASPNGKATGVHPITALLKMGHLSRTKKVEILTILIREGADVSKLTAAYPGLMSPVHVATKLALETDMVDIVTVTCDGYTFPKNGRLVDQDNRTPLHLACMSEDIVFSTKILQELSRYTIDKTILDDTGNRAQDYTPDEGRRLLVCCKPEDLRPKPLPQLTTKELINIDQIDTLEEYELTGEPSLGEIMMLLAEEEGVVKGIGFRIDSDSIMPRQPKGKWIGEWACLIVPYNFKTKHGENYYKVVAEHTRKLSQDYVNMTSWDNAAYSYVRTLTMYDLWQEHYPSAPLDTDRGLMYSNLSLCLLKWGQYTDAIIAADEALKFIPTSYKAHYRKAAACHLFGEAGTRDGHQGREVTGKYRMAIQEYAMSYTLMTDRKQIKFRSSCLHEILKIGLEKCNPNDIPIFHKFDEPYMITTLLSNIINSKDPLDKKCTQVEALLVKSDTPGSGFGSKYPYDANRPKIVIIANLLPHPSVELIKTLLAHGYELTREDVRTAVALLTKDRIKQLKTLCESFPVKKDRAQLMSDVSNDAIALDKLYFVPIFLELGFKPDKVAILKGKTFHTLDPLVGQYVANGLDPKTRTKELQLSLTADNKTAVTLLLRSGPIVPKKFDLSNFITSSAILKNPEFIGELIKAGVSPVGVSPNRTPLSVLFSSKDISNSQLLRLAEALISHGAPVDLMKKPSEETTTPVHISTKLALETGNIDFLSLVCNETQFPLSGRVVDNHIQTPLHLAARAKYNDRSTQVCKVLSKYCIDPKVRDQWNKTALDYCRGKADNRVPFLKKATKTVEDMNRRGSTVPVEVPEGATEESGKKKNKKKKKRNKKDKMEEEETVDEEDQQIEEEMTSTTDKVAVTSTRNVVSPPVKPIEPLYDIKTFLTKITSLSADYFVGSSSVHSSFQELATEKETSQHSSTWSSEVVLPLVDAKDIKLSQEAVAAIDDHPWEVECTENVLKFLKDDNCPLEIKTAAVERIGSLASGKWLQSLRTPLDPASDVYEGQLTTNSRILWDVSVQFSSKCTSKDMGKPPSARMPFHVFSEVIRIWDIVSDERQKKSCFEHILKSKERGLQANIDFNLLPQFLTTGSKDQVNKNNLPRKYLLKLDPSSSKQATKKNPYSQVQRFCPAASIKDDEFNVFVFYAFSSNLVSCMLGGSNSRRDFPFKEWPMEHDIINLPHNKESILLVGRSGTGKTTCCLYRLWIQFSDYWEQAAVLGAWHPHRPLMLQAPPTPNKGEDLEHLHQVFVTKNYVLCAQMRRRFYDLAASYPHLAYHLEYENETDPINLESIHHMAYPLFLTSRQFLLLLDASLNGGESFFPRNRDGVMTVKISSSDYSHENPDTLLDIEDSDDEDSTFDEGEDEDLPTLLQTGTKSQPTWREVTSLYFVNEIWPKISTGCRVDPLLVWMEIKSFIKGSVQAVETSEGYLSEQGYVALGKKMAYNFVGNREEVYKIFLRYENYLQKKRNLNLFDECQLVHSIYQRLINLDTDPVWTIHNFYLDEVQDFTQAELAVFIRSCREPNDMFLTGDTAQSIMRGISFRFTDLRSLFHYANDQSSQSEHPIKIQVPALHSLAINFRSHAGVLQLAASVIDLMKSFFPNSFDTLPNDRGMFPGPQPVFLQSCQESDLALLLHSNKRASSTIEFGAHQVIIVQNEDIKKSLPDVLKSGIVLTVFESKGLEFDDVLLYNFFSDSPVDKEWRVVTSYADQFHPSPSPIQFESKPRPLEFNEQYHKSLNSELKYLYTAITRAKCNLWIYDSDRARRLPIFDYWVRRGLIRVVRVGEKEEEDRILFTATSTPDQWKNQGDFFRRKGLWEPAMKCYHKAGDVLFEKEAQAYMYAQKAKVTGNPREVIGCFESAAFAFLYCDHLRHDVKFLLNAAKCLRNCRRHNDAAMLFEKLGESELAKRSFLKARDHSNIARLRESEGDYSGAVRAYVRANRRLQAIEHAQTYEREGHVLESDISSFQLANQYAKYFVSHKDETNLRKVLMYIDDPLVRVAHLRKGRLYRMALEEYIQSGSVKEAVELILAQEMYEQGIEMAKGRKELKMGMMLEPLFHLHRATARLYHTRNSSKSGGKSLGSLENTIEVLTSIGRDSEPAAKAKAKLLLGIYQEKSVLCSEALKLYQNPVNNTVASMEAFNEMVKLKKVDSSVQMIARQCFQADELSSQFISKSAKSKPAQKMAIEFYHLSHLDDVYLLPRSQDIWLGNLHAVSVIKEKSLDENGMIRLDPDKVHRALSSRFSGFVKEWAEKTNLSRRLKDQLQSYSYHKELSNDQLVAKYHEGFPHHLTTDYVSAIDLAMRLATIIQGSFDTQHLAKLVPNLFSPVFCCFVPMARVNCNAILKCPTVQSSLKSDVRYFLEERCLLKPHVDELFDAWRCSCLVNGVVETEKQMEDFAAKKGPGTVEQEKTKVWLFMDKKGKTSYHYFFTYLLKAYRLIRESCQVIGSLKIIFNCFLAVVGKRAPLRKRTSIFNLVTITNISTTALVALLSVHNPDTGLLVPYYYKTQCQVFDALNIQDDKDYCLLTACAQQIHDLRDERLARLVTESADLLERFLSFILGEYFDHCNVLDMVVTGKDEPWLMHVVVNALVLLANVRLLSKDTLPFVSESLERLESTIKFGIKREVKLSPCLKDYYSQLSQATSVHDILVIVQQLLSKFKCPTGIACLQPTKSGNVEFKEVSLGAHLHKFKIRVSNDPSPAPLPVTTPIVTPTSVNEPVVANSSATGTSGAHVTSNPAHSVTTTPQQPMLSQAPPMMVDPVLQTLQQQLMFIQQQRQQLDQFLMLINQQLVAIQQTTIEDPALYQQQMLQLRQQQYQASEALRQLDLQQQQINFKIVQHYNTRKLSPQFPGVTMPTQVPPTLTTPTQATPTPVQLPSTHNMAGNLPVPSPNVVGLNSQTDDSSSLASSKSPTPGGHANSQYNVPVDGAVKKWVDTDEEIDDEMQHLLVQSQSDFFAKEQVKAVTSPPMGTEDSELVDQYYCQVCGVSFKSEGSETNLEENSLASMFHNTNFQTHAEHVQSQMHKENYFSHSQFVSFRQQFYNEPRKQLDNLLDETAKHVDSADLERFVFIARSKLRDFDQQIEECRDAYKWRNAHGRTVSFVEEIASMSRQLMKMKTVESLKAPAIVPGVDEQLLADMVFIDDEEDLDIEDVYRRRRKDSHKK